jgi:hypothetical protein
MISRRSRGEVGREDDVARVRAAECSRREAERLRKVPEHLKALRKRAETSFGTRFDVREFHDVVLGSGAVPLSVLEANVDRWIGAQKTATASP